MSVILKAKANVQASVAPSRESAEPPIPVILKAAVPDTKAADKDKESAPDELPKEAQQQAKDAAKPIMMMAREEAQVKPGEEQQQEMQKKNVTVIADGYGSVDILKAKLIAQELPKDEGKGATAEEIAGLNSQTATQGKARQPVLEHGIA